MPEEKSIYQQTKNNDYSTDPQYVDLSMRQARNRFIRTIFLFLIVIIGGLSLAAYVIFSSEEEKQSGKTADGPNATAAIDPQTTAQNIERIQATIEMAQEPRTDHRLSARETAQAMGEVRIATKSLSERDFLSAEAHAKAALDIYPEMNEALRVLGLAYMHSGRFKQAVIAMKTALDQDPFSAETMNNLATVYIHQKEMDKAEEYLENALLLRPDYVAAKLNLGLLYLATANYADAVDYFSQALPMVPNDINVRNNLGVALLRMGKYEEAREQFDFGRNKAPGVLPLYINTAITYALQSDVTNAIYWIKEASRFTPPLQLFNLIKDPDFDNIRESNEFKALSDSISSPMPESQAP